MGNGRLPDVYYEQYVLGELDEHKKAQVESSPEFERRIAEIRESDSRILESYPPSEFAKRIRNAAEIAARESSRGSSERSASERRGSFLRSRAFTFALSAALLVAAATTVLVVGDFVPTEADAVRTKGLGAAIRVYRDAGEDVEVLESGAVVAQGDLLQLSYNAAGESYGAIFSIDGRGAFTLHFPSDPTASPRLEIGGEVLLPYAYQLDDAPEFEKFYFITADEPFDLNRILDTISEQIDRQRSDPDYELQFDASVDVSSLVLKKTE